MKVTRSTKAVLEAFIAAGPGEALYGLAIMKAVGVHSGTLYPILDRLEHAGWITGSWEKPDDDARGRPPRRYYTLTGLGAKVAPQALERSANRPRGRALRPLGGNA